MDFSILFTWDGILYLMILSLLEIILGIDNIIFISIFTDKLPKKQKRYARNIGLTLALLVRIFLLTFVAWIMQMNDPLFNILDIEFSAQSLVLFFGGLFLIYKSIIEMHNSVVGHQEKTKSYKATLKAVISQIILIDIVFSLDSIISAIGMTNGIGDNSRDPIIIIYIAVIISMLVMLLFASKISSFINQRPTIKMIALGFLVTIGVFLIAESFGQHIPKGYIYFAILFSLLVEFLNIRMRKNKSKRSL